MGDLFQILVFIICGILLLWFGYFLFFGPMSPIYPFLPWSKNKRTKANGKLQYCPVCGYKILQGEQLKTIVFPPAKSTSIDRIMHIKGCVHCLTNIIPRKCPICKTGLSKEDFLLSRMFERSMQKNHIHVLGCNKCRKV